jgi:hypothetical protein
MKTLNLRMACMIAAALLFAISVAELAHPTIACAIAKLLCYAQDARSADVAHMWRAIALVSLYACVQSSVRGLK